MVKESLILIVAVSVTVGCASAPTVMTFFPSGSEQAQDLVWPAPPDTPRYQFAGELAGERNFGSAEQAEPGSGERVIRWLVGLGAGSQDEPRELVRPQAGAMDDGGRIYVTDVGRKAVFVFDELRGKLFIWDRAGDYTSFVSPIGIVVGRDGEVLVADSGLRRIVRLDRSGEPRGSFAQGVVSRPTGLARDPQSGRIFVADTAQHDIKVFNDQGKLIQTIGRRGTKLGEFNAPTHLAYMDGYLYVSDTLNARVQVLTLAGDPVNSLGTRGLFVGNLTRPKGIAVDHDRNIYVVEGYYDHLLVFDKDGRFLLPIGGTGTAVGRFFLPAGAWTDKLGRVFIADMFNGRVVIFRYLGT
jgi:DNA-binding beta-propeller fold protein YncE